MAAIKHTQLHLFKRQHVSHQFGSGLFPFRAACDKVILDNPLAEWLAGHACRVAHAGKLFNLIQRFRRHRRDDTIHHRGGERHVLRNPGSQPGINGLRIGAYYVAHNMTVFRHIVAGHHGKRRETRRSAARQRGDNNARR